MARVLGSYLFEALRAAGLADNATRRVVIDITHDAVPTVYIERFGDERLVKVVEALATVQIEIKNGEG